MSDEDPRHFGSLTAEDITRRLARTSVLCVPFGTFEQHGPHLPIATDTILAEKVAAQVVRRFGESHDVWLLPSLPFGYSPEHAGRPGCVGLDLDVCLALLRGVSAAVARACPARGLLIVNGHGGNRGLLEAIVYELERDSGMRICVTHPTSLSRVPSGSPRHEVHAGMSETSVMLATAPDLVHMDRVSPDTGTTAEQDHAVSLRILDRGASEAWTSTDPGLSATGALGAPHLADRRLGQKIVDAAVEHHGPVLTRLRERIRAS